MKETQGEGSQGVTIGNEGTRCSLLADGTILSFKSPRKSTDKLLKLIRKSARCPNIVYIGKKRTKFIDF